MKIETEVLTPAHWPDVEALFGDNGACGGCWCMSWRVEKGERWEDLKGPKAKARFKQLVSSGEARGILAYVDGEPVGWAAMGPRRDFPRLDRAPSFECDDADRVWSMPCFFVKAGHRGRGVAEALMKAAMTEMRRRKVRIVEGYPVRPKNVGSKIPAAFAWTGPRALFDAAGFVVVGNEGGGKERVRKKLS
ncbi:MAG TPA: GNAT family N-acetyltransferase [Labilithrix sp.]|jgi:GNAT superfamily N-acetyltransferase|nr:GNAT family N-acetyltransferase [Labilithrix sp.]